MNVKVQTVPYQILDFIEPYIGTLFPGCIVGCATSSGRIAFAFGTQNGKEDSPVETTNLFDIASVTKAFLNTLVLKLIPEKELDQKVIDVVPMKGKYRDQITVRHLLTFGVEFGDRVQLSRITNRGELIYAVEHGDLVHMPGSTYRYTNVTSMLLTFYLQRKFGKQFDELLKQVMLDPLGMHKTGFKPHNLVATLNEIMPTEQTLERGIVQDESARLYGEPVGSAGLFSTVEDILTFGQAFLAEPTFLPVDVIKRMPVSQFESAAASFGLGMGLRHHNECDLANADGSPVVVLKKNGFSGVHFCVLPENDFCFVVFGNICFLKRPNGDKRDEFTRFHRKLLRLMYEAKF